MIVSEAVELLSHAELKQLKVKDDKSVVLGYINSAILEIYKKFNLWEEDATITMVSGTKIYELDGVDANVSMDLSGHQFLVLESVYDEEGEKLILNDEFAGALRNLPFPELQYGVSNPKYNRIEVITEVDAETIDFTYRAAPLDLTNEKATINLPPQFREALFSYVGYRAHGGISGSEKEENNTHYKRFMQSCGRIKTDGLTTRDDLVSTKFQDRGFP